MMVMARRPERPLGEEPFRIESDPVDMDKISAVAGALEREWGIPMPHISDLLGALSDLLGGFDEESFRIGKKPTVEFTSGWSEEAERFAKDAVQRRSIPVIYHDQHRNDLVLVNHYGAFKVSTFPYAPEERDEFNESAPNYTQMLSLSGVLWGYMLDRSPQKDQIQSEWGIGRDHLVQVLPKLGDESQFILVSEANTHGCPSSFRRCMEISGERNGVPVIVVSRDEGAVKLSVAIEMYAE